ncbi:MAG: SDR family oxidoreductase [Anaerolineae bacterium]|nr:SDR family oxidoreductase [Anaerolineae bacterium]
MQLNDKVALVTGAGSGLGQAAAIRLIQAGAKVALLGRNIKELRQTQSQIRHIGGDSLVIEGDISNANSMQQATGRIFSQWRRLDIVFANAGINGVWAPLEELIVEEWDETMNNNLRGTFLTVKYAVPYLKKNGGSVIITSSVNGTRMFSNTGASAYATSKGAQVAFAKMIALELAPFHVRVNVICPGAIESEIDENTEKRDLDTVATPVEFPKGSIPLTGGSPGKAGDVGNLVLFLASDLSKHISGTEIWIDGAQSLLQG